MIVGNRTPGRGLHRACAAESARSVDGPTS